MDTMVEIRMISVLGRPLPRGRSRLLSGEYDDLGFNLANGYKTVRDALHNGRALHKVKIDQTTKSASDEGIVDIWMCKTDPLSKQNEKTRFSGTEQEISSREKTKKDYMDIRPCYMKCGNTSYSEPCPSKSNSG
jgi:hypothetical protein